jgi:hypothetical protein
MKKVPLLMLVLILSLDISGQIVPEKLMTKRFLSCEDIFTNVTYLIPELHGKGSKDTLNAVMDYWEKSCGETEPLVRCKILLAIEDNTFTESTYDNSIIYFLLAYKKNGYKINSYSYGTFRPYYQDNFSLEARLDLFTTNLAGQLMLRDDLTKIERFLVQLYAKDYDFSFAQLNSGDFDGSKIQQCYFDEIKKNKKDLTGHGDLIAGVWMPLDNLSLIGVHPVFGFRSGFKYKKLYTDLNISFRFGKSPNVFQVEQNDSVWNTTHYFGGYIGIDLGYNLFSFGNNDIDLLSGIAYDGFDVLSVKTYNYYNDISKSLSSLNLNLGIGFKHYLNSLSYYGFDLKYNFVNYKNTNGTDLSGNTITLNFIIGFFSNRVSDSRLRQLDYHK